MKTRILAAITLGVASILPCTARADTNALALINLTGGITAYTGVGVNIGQIEAGGTVTNDVDLNGNNVVIIGATNGTGTASQQNVNNHATEVASVIVSTGVVTRGVAPGATLYEDNAISPATAWLLATQTVGAAKIINMSFYSGSTVTNFFTFGPATTYVNPVVVANALGTDTLSQTIDNIAANNGVIFVKSAGNSGRFGTNTVTNPGAAYNIITVGAVSNLTLGTTSVANFSSQGYLVNGRSAVDILAVGANVTMDGFFTNATSTFTAVYSNNVGSATTVPVGSTSLAGARSTVQAVVSTIDTNSGTSFAAPMVSGVTADLVQYGNTLGTNANAATDPRTIKAVLLNSATKLAGWTQGAVVGAPTNQVGGVLYPGGTTVRQPLDPSQGAGLLNANGSYLQLAAGKQGGVAGFGIPAVANVGLTGWDFNVAPIGLTNLYRIASQTQGTLALTLDWNRDVITSVTNLSTSAGTNLVFGMADVNLLLFNGTDNLFTNISLAAQSISTVDNLQQLWFTNMPSGYYEFGVNYSNYVDYATPGYTPNLEDYSVAWNFTAVPEPSTLLLAGLGISSLCWRLRRRRRT